MLTAAFLTLLGLALACTATIGAFLVVPSGGPVPRRAWSVAALSVCALAAATLSKTTSLLDLLAILGVVLVGGIAGAGWAPSGKRALLVMGSICLSAAAIARFLAFSDAAPIREAVTQSVADVSLSWATARASGFVAFLAATGAIVLAARRPARLPLGGLPARVYALHRALGIAVLLATAAHLLALWLDDFIDFTLSQLLLVPWTATYAPLGVTLGWLAMLFLVLAAASGVLRRLLPGWRVIHVASYFTFALGLSHGLMAGTDAGSPLALAFYLAALLAVGWASYRRLFLLPFPPSHSSKKTVAKVPVGGPPGLPDTTTSKGPTNA
jgi:methionine sulfoxide reductase heme-binding subunit